LGNHQIPTMKSGKTFKELAGDMSGMSYIQFEIAQSGQYRFYEYVKPFFFRYVDAASNNMYSFLEYFNEQMSVQVYTPRKAFFLDPK
jgi:hypothetical protein